MGDIFVFDSWEEVVDSHYALQLQPWKPETARSDEEAVAQLQSIPRLWSLEHDGALVQMMAQHIPHDNVALGSIQSYVERVEVSSSCVSWQSSIKIALQLMVQCHL